MSAWLSLLPLQLSLLTLTLHSMTLLLLKTVARRLFLPKGEDDDDASGASTFTNLSLADGIDGRMAICRACNKKDR